MAWIGHDSELIFTAPVLLHRRHDPMILNYLEIADE
jgi:hypothetical protein